MGCIIRHDAAHFHFSPNLETDGCGQIFGNKIFVVRFQFTYNRRIRAFGIQVVRIEFLYPFKHFPVVIIHQVLVGMLTVLGIE
jgi:hypothetical protein